MAYEKEQGMGNQEELQGLEEALRKSRKKIEGIEKELKGVREGTPREVSLRGDLAAEEEACTNLQGRIEALKSPEAGVE